MAPGGCASSSHPVFIAVNRKESAYAPLARTEFVRYICAQALRKAALLWAAMGPLKFRGSVSEQEGRTNIEGLKQALSQALGAGEHMAGPSSSLTVRPGLGGRAEQTGLTF